MSKEKKYTIHGFDAYGQPVTEAIYAPARSWKQTVRILLIRLLGYRVSYVIGLPNWRKITGISVDGN